jgi:hypothetical protein
MRISELTQQDIDRAKSIEYVWDYPREAHFEINGYYIRVTFWGCSFKRDTCHFGWSIGPRSSGTGIFTTINATLKNIIIEYLDKNPIKALFIDGSSARNNAFYAKEYARWRIPGYKFVRIVDTRIARSDDSHIFRSSTKGDIGVAFVRKDVNPKDVIDYGGSQKHIMLI